MLHRSVFHTGATYVNCSAKWKPLPTAAVHWQGATAAAAPATASRRVCKQRISPTRTPTVYVLTSNHRTPPFLSLPQSSSPASAQSGSEEVGSLWQNVPFAQSVTSIIEWVACLVDFSPSHGSTPRHRPFTSRPGPCQKYST